VVCTDWSLVNDSKMLGFMFLPARDWGMEEATKEERVQKIIDAGVDQFGGESCPELVVKLVQEGKISMDRIDASIRRILRLKFEMGLFDQPFVDVENSVNVVGNSNFKAVASLAHRKSMVLLKNDTISGAPLLPLKKGLKVYLKNVNRSKLDGYATVVEKPEEADVAIIRLECPFSKLKGSGMLGKFIRGGDLDFQGKEKEEILDLLAKVPTVVDITLTRPAVIPEIAAASKALIGSFSSPDEALLDVIFGNFNPRGKLPFELPFSMEAVRNQMEDVPYDSKNPVFPFGFGLGYN
jgi:beta-glucosidase